MEQKLWDVFYLACQKGQIEIVKLFLNDNIVDINKASNYGETPFYRACRSGYIEIVKLLLNNHRVDINKANRDYWTPFYIACRKGHIEIVKLLLNDNRIDLHKTRDIDDQTPFSIACNKGHVEIVEYIIASGRDVDMIMKENNMKTEIGIARKVANEEKLWGTKEEYQEGKIRYGKIAELLESFERNPNETRTKLRIQLGFAGKFNLIYYCVTFNFFFSFLSFLSFLFLMFILLR